MPNPHTSVPRGLLPLAWMLLSLWSGFAPAAVTDQRTSLVLTPAEQAEFLSEMRRMLNSVQGILAGIGSQDRQKIAAAARDSGNRMARATPESVRQKMPQAFKDLGGPTHMLFEELVVRADTDDMDMLVTATAELMQQCLACHALFRVH